MSSDLHDSLQGVAVSDISIYRSRPTRRSFAEKAEQEYKDVFYQKIWVIVHSLIFLLVALETIFLLSKKNDILEKFYGESHNGYYQCCYCSWIAIQQSQNDKKEIEYSYCDQHWKSYDSSKVCDINQTKYCNANTLNDLFGLTNDNKVSTTSTFLFYPFPKSYLYYGILGLSLVFLYAAFICIATFKYNIRLSSLLFVGNIVVAIQCYYNYIKAYQYTYTKYNMDCENENLGDLALKACYQNVVSRFLSQLLSVMVTFFMIYFIYPVVFYVFGCCTKRCSWGYKCSVIQSYIERFLLYVGVIGGLCFVLLSFIVLIIVIQDTKKFEMMKERGSQYIEKWLCIITGIILLICSLDVFCLPHCRRRAILMIKARKIPKWKDAVLDIDEFQQYQMDESVDMTELPSKTIISKSKKNPNSPLLE